MPVVASTIELRCETMQGSRRNSSHICRPNNPVQPSSVSQQHCIKIHPCLQSALDFTEEFFATSGHASGTVTVTSPTSKTADANSKQQVFMTSLAEELLGLRGQYAQDPMTNYGMQCCLRAMEHASESNDIHASDPTVRSVHPTRFPRSLNPKTLSPKA